MQRSPIQWTDFTANPLKYRAADGRVVWACEKLSAGCKNCYAADLSLRYGGVRRAGEWNAATMAMLKPFLDENELHAMRTYKPASGQRVFVGDMTDIFGDWVSDDLLNRLFSETLERRTDVTWQILTKRASRMCRYLSWRYGPDDECPRGRIPARHIHVGVSVEGQREADERIGHLLMTPAAVRFISAEPLLEATDLHLGGGFCRACGEWTKGTIDGHCFNPDLPCFAGEMAVADGIDWVIVGGESGHRARAFDLEWGRAIVAQCKAAHVPVFVKQLGANAVVRNDDRHEQWPGCTVPLDDDYEPRYQGETAPLVFHHSHGADPKEWPRGLRVRQFPTPIQRIA